MGSTSLLKHAGRSITHEEKLGDDTRKTLEYSSGFIFLCEKHAAVYQPAFTHIKVFFDILRNVCSCSNNLIKEIEIENIHIMGLFDRLVRLVGFSEPDFFLTFIYVLPRTIYNLRRKLS